MTTTYATNAAVSAAIDNAAARGLDVCEHCGAIISDENAGRAIHCGGSAYCAAECAARAGLAVCDGCGEWFDADDAVTVGENVYCDDDCAREAGYECCAHCGEWASEDDCIYTEDGPYCSDDCAERDGWRRCADCGEWVRDYDTHTTRDGGSICQRCYDYHYCYCSECEEIVHESEWDYDAGMCDDCAEDCESGLLREYGYTPVLTFHGDTCDNSRPYLGVELETDQDCTDTDSRNRYLRALSKMDHFQRVYLTRDGSLDCGVEVTSHPMTLDEHIGCGLWDEVREAADEHGFTSHDNGRCGLHVHINRSFFGKSYKAQSVGGLNLTMLVGRFERQIMDFARRRDAQWCAFGAHRNYTGNGHMAKCGIFEKADHLDSNIRYSHSVAVNMQHSQTFELRIFRGTLRKRTFNATLALAEGLAQAAKHHAATWCEACTWYELVGWILDNLDNPEARDDLRGYLAEKGLF